MESPSFNAFTDWMQSVGWQTALLFVLAGIVYKGLALVNALMGAARIQYDQRDYLKEIRDAHRDQVTAQEDQRRSIDTGFQQNRMAVAEVKADGDARLGLLHTIDSKIDELKTLVIALQKGD